MPGETTSGPSHGIRIEQASFEGDMLVAYLADGRIIATPLAWYPRLLSATPEQRAAFQISGAGFGLHWPALDEDLSVEGMLRGTALRSPAGEFAAPPEPPEAGFARLEARKWVQSFLNTRSSRRFPDDEFLDFTAELLVRFPKADPSLRAGIVRAAQAEAQELWWKMHPPGSG